MTKKSKKLIALLTVVALLVLAPGSVSFTSRAADPVTYSLKYIGGDSEWGFQQDDSLDDSLEYQPLSSLLNILKDGDSIVVYASNSGFQTLNLGNVKLDNLTVYQNAQAAITTGGVRECYILAGAYCAVNGDVTSAFLYDNTTCTFNNNVKEMTLYFSDHKPASNITCGGKVGHFSAIKDGAINKYLELFDVRENAFVIKDGKAQIPEDAYKTQANAASSTNDDDEYDRVPKTGETKEYAWLLFVSALCFTGSCILRKKETH